MMSNPVTHIFFEQGTAIQPAFSRAMVPEQRRDPININGYWLVNVSEERARELAKKHGQRFSNMKADLLHPAR